MRFKNVLIQQNLMTDFYWGHTSELTAGCTKVQLLLKHRTCLETSWYTQISLTSSPPPLHHFFFPINSRGRGKRRQTGQTGSDWCIVARGVRWGFSILMWEVNHLPEALTSRVSPERMKSFSQKFVSVPWTGFAAYVLNTKPVHS